MAKWTSERGERVSLAIFHFTCTIKIVQTSQPCSNLLMPNIQGLFWNWKPVKGKQCRNKILNSQSRFIPFVSPLFGLNSELKLFLPFLVFYWGNSCSFRHKSQIPFCSFPSSEKNRTANPNADTIIFHKRKRIVPPIKTLIRFSTVKIRFLFHPFTSRKSIYVWHIYIYAIHIEVNGWNKNRIFIVKKRTSVFIGRTIFLTSENLSYQHFDWLYGFSH